MNILPGWAPNIHPLVVHFPIAILIIAVVFDFFSLIFRKQDWLSKTTVSLFIIGALTAIVALYTGHEAAEHLQIPKTLLHAVNTHAEWAQYTVWYFSIFAAFRLVLLWFNKNRISSISVIAFLLGFVGLFLLYETGEHGGNLVYNHNLGTSAYQKELTAALRPPRVSESEVVLFDNGGWSWHPGDHAQQVLQNDFTFVEGNLEEVNPSGIVSDKDTVLSIKPKHAAAMFVFNKKMSNPDILLEFNRNDFKGDLSIVEHVSDKDNYEYLSVYKDLLVLGRVRNGQKTIHEKSNISINGWTVIQLHLFHDEISCSVNKKNVFKIRLSELPAGKVGLKIEGTGKLLVKDISAKIATEN